MTKYLPFIFFGLFFIACSNGQPEHTTPTEVPPAEVEAIEQSIDQVDESLQESEKEMKKNQDEIDSLLKNI